MGSFAKTFDMLFADIFGIYSKPRLRRARGRWICEAKDGSQGFGVTPGMAYGSWLLLRGDSWPGRHVQRKDRT